MTAKDFTKFCKLAAVKEYKCVYSKTKPTERQMQYARQRGISVAFRQRDKKWFELDFYGKA
jgi:hypothetical protein